MTKIFLTNLGEYNNGRLIGEWLPLPYTEQQLDACMERIGNPEEWFITDTDSDLPIDIQEYANLSELNEQFEEVAAYDADLIAALIECGYSLQESLEMADNVTFYPGETLEDVAYNIVNECYELPEFALQYFDYTAFARDLSYDGYTETTYGTICTC